MKLKINKILTKKSRKKNKNKKNSNQIEKNNKWQIGIEEFNWNFFYWRIKLKTNKTLTKKSKE